jgi:hypothetical protein
MLNNSNYSRKSALKDDIFNHLESVFTAAFASDNLAVALKALELCFKAKLAIDKNPKPTLNLRDLSEEELEHILQTNEFE